MEDNLPAGDIPFMSDEYELQSSRSGPIIEHNRYFNKESVKVNAGLTFDVFAQAIPAAQAAEPIIADLIDPAVADALETITAIRPEPIIADPLQLDAERRYAPDTAGYNTILLPKAPTIDFSTAQIVIPPDSIGPAPQTSVEAQIQTLLHPERHAFVHGVLSLQWVIGAVGHRNFEWDEDGERWVLGHASELRLRGAELGLPVVYLEWLCGGDGVASPSEMGVLLTPRFFEDLRKERDGGSG